MSADAKVWKEDGEWFGIHDGECLHNLERHADYSLSFLLLDVELCMTGETLSIRWEPYVYPDRQCGLKGYLA